MRSCESICKYALLVREPVKYHASDDGLKALCQYPGSGKFTQESCFFPIDQIPPDPCRVDLNYPSDSD